MHESIRTGRLPAGTRLPSSRSLAKDLGIARNTVADAYGQLVAEGWLTARQGSGTVVANRATHACRTAVADRVTSLPQAKAASGYDLTPGSPDVSTFPRGEWLAAARKALPAAPNEASGTAIRAAGSSCGGCSPTTSPGRAESGPIRSGS